MTLLEALLAMVLLIVFTGVVTLVMQFTLRFFAAAESGEENEFDVSNGVLIDHQHIQMAMDDLVEVLSQPGISMEGLAYAPKYENLEDACPAARPITQWGLPIEERKREEVEALIPPGYRLCLWKTSAGESLMPDLIADDAGAKPGIYLLQALPEQLSSSSLPTRRLFCRPRPFC
ncbi:hypothetical protein [Synechococcus sp. MU1617]|uniref:hypothetical protein n=1 Tax=Synechococcus sp. MU1617 TaxID=2508346 RepID=UPI001CF8C9A8|nr:hypothetical protein [Synechococcus sp. MU1617]MCB4389102.1 hypothetical protein [Synechococcus sp. MU1617]